MSDDENKGGEDRYKTHIIPISDSGRPVGQYHWRAKLSDADVETIRDMGESGLYTHRQIAERFGVAKSTVTEIISFRKRATTAMGWKRVRVRYGTDTRFGQVHPTPAPKRPCNDP